MSARRGSGWLVAAVVVAAVSGWLFVIRDQHADGEWAGVDEAVIGHFVEVSGGPHAPALIDWVHGDLLLFAFLCAGLIAGFVIGFYARAALGEHPKLRAAENETGGTTAGPTQAAPSEAGE